MSHRQKRRKRQQNAERNNRRAISIQPQSQTGPEQEQAEDKLPAPIENWSRDQKIQVWILVAAIAYGALTAGLWHEAHNTMIADQRAWVSVKEFEIVGVVAVGQATHLNITAINTGKTPAREVRLAECGTGDTEAATLEWNCKMDSRDVIAPAAIRIFLSASEPATQVYIEALAAGKVKTYFRGAILYNDVFNKPRRSRFCAYYNGRGAKSFFACPHGNEME